MMPLYYEASYVMRRKATSKGMLYIDLWRFKSLKKGKIYLVEVEVYEKHIYGIKFYLKSQSHKKTRYNFKTNDFEPRTIVLSCIHIMKHYFETDSKSSFAFIGSNNIGESTKCTKRFRFYRTMMNTYFGRQTFEHWADENNSAYLMLRKTEINEQRINIKEVSDFFLHIYMLI